MRFQHDWGPSASPPRKAPQSCSPLGYPGWREDLVWIPTLGGTGGFAPSAPPRWPIFVKRVTQMSWPRFVYIFGNCCGKEKNKPFEVLSNLAICAFEGRVGPRKVGLQTG